MHLKLHPRQLAALNTSAQEVLYGGATSGGKSHLIRVALIGWCLAIEGLQCVLIRKRYDDILKNHVDGPTGFISLLSYLTQIKAVTITQKEIRFHNGSVIAFQHCQDERQFDSAQGVEKHVLAIDEATQISERLIRFFRGWVRMPLEMQARLPEEHRGRFPRILYTANPIGQSVGFFRREFVQAREPFDIEKVEGFLRQYIPSRVTDNPSIDIEAHKGRLAGIGDSQLAKALDEGSWDAMVGDFYPEWDEKRHVIPQIIPPIHWFKYRAFDWGTAEPFSVLWAAISDGESFRDHNSQPRWFPKGSIIIYKEWYGCDPEHPDKGLRMRNEDIAQGILARSDKSEIDMITLTDSLPFQDRGGPTIASIFGSCGVSLTQADTSRIGGWSQLRDRLIGKEIDSNDASRTPMIFFTENCKFCRDYVPSLERHPTKLEDATEHGEPTHILDSIRYLCASRPLVLSLPKKPEELILTPNNLTFEQAIKKISTIKKHDNNYY